MGIFIEGWKLLYLLIGVFSPLHKIVLISKTPDKQDSKAYGSKLH